MFLAFLLRLIPSTRDVSKTYLEWIYRILPSYDFCFGLISISSRVFWKRIFGLSELPSAWTEWGALIEFIYLMILSVIFYLTIIIIERGGFSCKRKDRSDKMKAEEIGEDEDLINERNDVMNSDDSEFVVKVLDINKTYTFVSQGALVHKQAVKGISFGVRRGEVFGLLGTNGAGKTSTFRILSGEYTQTSGIAKIAGYDLTTNMKDVRHLIGYCPQFDAIIENLTAREHLELFAEIKGIPKNYSVDLIEKMLNLLNLKKYENVQAGTYSGGNKRKLSVAMALLGNPPIILLDEPSSGMDPEARRFMWKVISKVSTEDKNSSVILTTHSMDEAEALSSKLAIMVEGKFACIGPVQKLKNKFGKGFEVETKLKGPTADDLEMMKKTSGISDVNQRINEEEVKILFEKLGTPWLTSELKQHGKASSIQNELIKNQNIATKMAFELIDLQLKAEKLKAELTKLFGEVSLIESVNNFFRWKVENNVNLSAIFGFLEKSKDIYFIDEYSVKQASIEQIFINFANTQDNKGDD